MEIRRANTDCVCTRRWKGKQTALCSSIDFARFGLLSASLIVKRVQISSLGFTKRVTSSIQPTYVYPAQGDKMRQESRVSCAVFLLWLSPCFISRDWHTQDPFSAHTHGKREGWVFVCRCANTYLFLQGGGIREMRNPWDIRTAEWNVPFFNALIRKGGLDVLIPREKCWRHFILYSWNHQSPPPDIY